MKADYKTMDIEKAIETWNDEREIYGNDENDDLWIFDNDRGGLDTIFCDIYDALNAVSRGSYDIQDDYIYQYKDGLYSFTYRDEATAPWNMVDD